MSIHHPSFVLVFASLMGIAVATVLIVVGYFWTRLRSLAVEETARRVDDLARRQETIESLVGRLETMAGKGGGGVPGSAGAARTTPGAAAGTPGRPDAPGLWARARGALRVDRAEPEGVGRPTLIAVPSLAAVDVDASEAAAELGRRFGAIWTRADSGDSPESIARATGQPIGQIELILGLRRHLLQAGQSGGPPPR
jgi:hypothetical protein